MLTFNELALVEPLLKNLRLAGYQTPTPVQAQAIPVLLEGNDLLGIAQTGTGKTAAFSIPIIQKLATLGAQATPYEPKVLILAPTRELTSQINKSLETYAQDMGLSTCAIYGGVGQATQVKALRAGVDVLVATPGRLIDLKDQGYIRFNQVQVFVLDEADRMLDMGFIDDIKKIIGWLPSKKQTMLFSATMPAAITKLANKVLKNPTRVEVNPASTTVDTISQKVIYCKKADKYQLLRKILGEEDIDLVLVFTRTRNVADQVVQYLTHHHIPCSAIHGEKAQADRERALNNFKEGRIRVLVATDIAARGIDVQGVTHVINFDLPLEAESYVHRIGRTARAGKSGDAISFCDEGEKGALERIQRLIQLYLPEESYTGVPEVYKPSRLERNSREVLAPTPGLSQEKPRAQKDHSKRQKAVAEGGKRVLNPALERKNMKKKKKRY